jgi:predicted nicotinamide N-methyase
LPITVCNHHNNDDPDDVEDEATTDTTTTTTTLLQVRQVQRGEVDGTYGTGATVWPAAVVLVKYLQRHGRSAVRRRRVIDLGSGTGITSIACHFLGARSVICTDGVDPVVRLARQNIDRNVPKDEQPGRIRVERYWWGDDDPPRFPKDDDDDDDGGADLVLVADCVLPKLYPIGPLVQAIDDCLTSRSTSDSRLHTDQPHATPMAILSYEHRYYPDYDPRDKFRELANKRSLHVRTVPIHDMDPVYSVPDIELWIVTRK